MLLLQGRCFFLINFQSKFDIIEVRHVINIFPKTTHFDVAHLKRTTKEIITNTVLVSNLRSVIRRSV